MAASSGSNTLAMSFAGLVCADPNAALQTSVSGGFIILNGAGKFANSGGTGQLNMFVADDLPGGHLSHAGNGVPPYCLAFLRSVAMPITLQNCPPPSFHCPFLSQMRKVLPLPRSLRIITCPDKKA